MWSPRCRGCWRSTAGISVWPPGGSARTPGIPGSGGPGRCRRPLQPTPTCRGSSPGDCPVGEGGGTGGKRGGGGGTGGKGRSPEGEGRSPEGEGRNPLRENESIVIKKNSHAPQLSTARFLPLLAAVQASVPPGSV